MAGDLACLIARPERSEAVKVDVRGRMCWDAAHGWILLESMSRRARGGVGSIRRVSIGCLRGDDPSRHRLLPMRGRVECVRIW